MEHRHPLADAKESSLFGSLTAEEFYDRHSVTHSTSSFVNGEGLRIFTQSWIPKKKEIIKGIVCVIHGYTSESSWFVQLTSVFFAEAGFAVCALDHRGHGFSDGLVCHLPDLNPVVDDCVTYFTSFRSQHHPSLPCFVYAESLGGAIALLLHLNHHKNFHVAGLVLHCAMCGISDKIKPPWPLEHLLSLAAAVIPEWKVVPTRGTIPDVSFKVEWKRKLALACPRRHVARPRAATALELIRACRELQSRFEEVTAPLLIVHGSEDVLCDPACVQDLHDRASSQDKTIRIYPGMWHQLIGEPDEDVDRVFGQVLHWLISRASSTESSNNPSS